MKRIYLLNLLVLGLLALSNCKITNLREAEDQIEKKFLDAVQNKKTIKNASILIHSDKLALHVSKSYGKVNDGKTEVPAIPIQPFHTASIGKMFTSVLILQDIEKGKYERTTPIFQILGKNFLSGLFVREGKDYSEEVTIEQLLNHTSGIADYFESTGEEKSSQAAVIHEITKNPNQFWTPNDLVTYTRVNQKAVGKPGEKFSYSDTGYILLGLILETIHRKKFEDLLSERIFFPLQMNSTYMHLRSKPKLQNSLALSHMFLGDTEVTQFKSVSADWSGGGLISTTEDLLLFQKALVSGKLVSSKTYESMKGEYQFMDGIYYGLGLMTVRFGDMLFLMAGTPELHGHSGLLSTLTFYAPAYDAHIIANFGSTEDVSASFEMMFHLMRILKEVNELKR